ncbi:hypothetical protein A2U01_0109646, partial [Trifolium medium]|nr:hypothetical protein [Trifolium medium]
MVHRCPNLRRTGKAQAIIKLQHTKTGAHFRPTSPWKLTSTNVSIKWRLQIKQIK